ncbi:hypothetical protein [Paraburkholderia aromaticivorans]|uniref:hypothetical protein n=1 Tax=Paraburkholderia aromaticivorans TaxID=2026199 RepID=UPI001455E962|nr:hypothetical protein [Paraburkholderia aromaticivorans]
MNELNWLVRLLLIARIPNDASDPERRATIYLALLIVKLLAAKMHEGWEKLRNGINDLVDASLSAEGRDIKGQLANCLAKGSIIHGLRNRHALRYLTDLSISDLEMSPLNDDELVTYMSENHGHNLFHLSELAAIASLPSLMGKRDAGESFEAVMEEVVKVAGLYSDCLYAVVIAVLGDELIEQLNPERVHEESDRVAAAGRIKFFELPERG